MTEAVHATDRSLTCVVLAAGEGKRMRSNRPKPLHLLCGRAMLLHVLDRLADVPVDRAVVVVGHGAERVTKKLVEDGPDGLPIDFVEQQVQRGTGDAVSVAITAFRDEEDAEDDDGGDVLVAPGDMPLVRSETLRALVEHHRATDAAATVLSFVLDDPSGYGRVVRGKDDRVERIVEHRDADPEERAIRETNSSFFVFKRSLLPAALRRITPDNEQGEYYLTDVVQVLSDAGHKVESLVGDDPLEMSGVNDRSQLAQVEAHLRRRTNDRWMAAGVTMVDPAATYVDASVRLGVDVTLFPGAMLQGRTVVGDGAEIGPNSRLVDCTVGARAVVQETIAELAEIGDDARVGPFAHLVPGSAVAPGATTGPFYTSASG